MILATALARSFIASREGVLSELSRRATGQILSGYGGRRREESLTQRDATITAVSSHREN
jgi:hypothetical protein